MAKKILLKLAKTIWHIIKIGACLYLILATFFFGYEYLNQVFRNPDVDYGESFHNLPEDSMDIIVLGSSHAQYSFVPSFTYQDTGLYSYVLGSPCQPLKVSRQMLKEALKTQSPEVVLLEVYTATPLREACDGDTCYVTAEYQMRGQEKLDTINYLPEEKAKTYLNDFINYHNNWRTMESYEDFIYKPNYSIDYSFGFVENVVELPAYNSWYALKFDENEEVTLDKDDQEALDDIYQICKENDIELLLYMMPMDSLDVTNQSYRYKVWEWADKNNIKYFDFVDMSEEIDYRMQIHSDGFHSYSNGASFITDYLSKYIVENCSIKKHKDNEFLNAAYQENLPGYALSVLRTEYNPYKYLSRFNNYSGVVALKYSGNVVNKDFLEYFKSIIKDENFNEEGQYFAIIENGKVKCSDNNLLECDTGDKHITIDSSSIKINDEIIETNGDLSLIMFNEDNSVYEVKNIATNPHVWDYGYDFEYNKIN